MRVEGLGCRVQGVGFRVSGFGFQVSGVWFRVLELDFGVEGVATIKRCVASGVRHATQHPIDQN